MRCGKVVRPPDQRGLPVDETLADGDDLCDVVEERLESIDMRESVDVLDQYDIGVEETRREGDGTPIDPGVGTR